MWDKIHFKQTKAICWKEDPGVSMPLGPSHSPHFRQKTNPPLLSLTGKYTQTFPSGQAPHEDGTSGTQQQICASTSAEH